MHFFRIESTRHERQILFRHFNDTIVNFHLMNLLDQRMLYHCVSGNDFFLFVKYTSKMDDSTHTFTSHTTVSSTDNKNFLRIRMTTQWNEWNHFLISELITFGTLYYPIQNQRTSMCFTEGEDEKKGLFLPWPLNVYLSVNIIYKQRVCILFFIVSYVSNTLISWNADVSSCKTLTTFNEKHWPGHKSSEISLNHPFRILSILEKMVFCFGRHFKNLHVCCYCQTFSVDNVSQWCYCAD